MPFWKYIHMDESLSLPSAYENLYLKIQQFTLILKACGCFTVPLGSTWYTFILSEHMLVIYIPYEHVEQYGFVI